MEKNMFNIKKEFASKGIFYTQPELAETLKKYIDIEYHEVYDPTCGQGNLLASFDDSIKKYGQELDPIEVNKANERLKNATIFEGDTLTDDKFKGRQFELIVANPPFSIKWEPFKDERFKVCDSLAPKSKADYAFLLHILNHLKDNGQAICLEFPGILYRGNAEGKIRKWFVENNYIDKVIRIGGDRFVDTKIETAILVLKKNKTNNKITFIDTVLQKEKEVDFKEIKENNFILSVNNYIQEERQIEKIDINELNKEVRKVDIKQFEKLLEYDRFVSELQGNKIEHVLYCKSMLEILEKHIGEIKNEMPEL